MNLNYKSLGLKIRKVRNEKGLTQEELAEKSGLSAPYIGIIERADKVPSIETLVKIASTLDISIDYLLSDSLHLSSEVRANEIILALDELDNSQIDLIVKVIHDIASHFKTK